jgi:soluble lytic murein transglycosylase-like protein
VATLSAIFTAEVQYWASEITAWAAAYRIDPNLIATVIQIESCGNPSVHSAAGAQGLFQVMPFHFAAGEDMLDVQTNARRGLEYLQGALKLAQGNVAVALAGYNGGYKNGWRQAELISVLLQMKTSESKNIAEVRSCSSHTDH